MNSFPQGLCKSLFKSCLKVCEKVSTLLIWTKKCGLILWESRGCGKVFQKFSDGFYTLKIVGFSLLGGKFYTFST